MTQAYRLGNGGNETAFDTNGRQTMAGNARVYAYDWIDASAIQSSGTKPAEYTVNTNGFAVIEFADNAEKEIQFSVKVHDCADLTADMAICVGWSSPTQSANCNWLLTYLVTAVNESTEAAGTPVDDLYASSATANGLVLSPIPIPAAAFSAGDVCIHCKLERDGDDETDTLSAVAHLHGIALKCVRNCLGGAV